jgi:hypothetical protein
MALTLAQLMLGFCEEWPAWPIWLDRTYPHLQICRGRPDSGTRHDRSSTSGQKAVATGVCANLRLGDLISRWLRTSKHQPQIRRLRSDSSRTDLKEVK